MKPHLIIFGILAVCMLIFSCQKEQKPTNRSQAALVDFYGIPMLVDTLDLELSESLSVFKVLSSNNYYFFSMIDNNEKSSPSKFSTIRVKKNGTLIDTLSYDTLQFPFPKAYDLSIRNDSLHIQLDRASHEAYITHSKSLSWERSQPYPNILYEDENHQIYKYHKHDYIIFIHDKQNDLFYAKEIDGVNNVFKIDSNFYFFGIESLWHQSHWFVKKVMSSNLGKPLPTPPSFKTDLEKLNPFLFENMDSIEEVWTSKEIYHSCIPSMNFEEKIISVASLVVNDTIYLIEQTNHGHATLLKLDGDSVINPDSINIFMNSRPFSQNNDNLYSGVTCEDSTKTKFLLESRNDGLFKTILRLKKDSVPIEPVPMPFGY